MHIFIRILLFCSLCAQIKAALTTSSIEEVTQVQEETHEDEVVVHQVPMDIFAARQDEERVPKTRSSPVYYDTPVQQIPQQSGGLLGLNTQNLPIIGTLVGNIPGLVTGLPTQLGNGLNGLTSSLGLGGLGGITNLGGLGQLVGLGQPQQAIAQCPVSQTLRCRCEPLVPVKLPGTRKNSNSLQVVKQRVRRNEDGSKELSAELSNGLSFYQKSLKKTLNGEEQQVTQGFYALRLDENRYLTIYYTVNDVDFTVKAEVGSQPPKPVLEI